MKIVLYRTHIGEQITFGYLTIDGQLVCHTLERTCVMLSEGIYPIQRLSDTHLTHGNGVYRLTRPDIIVGEYRCRGLLIHSASTYSKLYQRIYHQLRVRQPVSMLVVNPN